MILLIDNYDSFTYNLYQLIGAVEPNIKVVRNDALSVDDALALEPSHIVISPGPGRPDKAGISEALIEACAALPVSQMPPLLGVCLGHQALCEVFGGTITYAPRLMHGKASKVTLDTNSTLFAGLPSRIEVARYHSLVASAANVPSELRVIATITDSVDSDDTAGADDDIDSGVIMAVEHRTKPLFGVQFHPESILTPQGSAIIKNLLSKDTRV